MHSTRRVRAALATVAATLILAACGSQSDTPTPQSAAQGAEGTDVSSAAATDSPAGAGNEAVDSDTVLTVYNAQHENLTQAWADAFTAETGIAVELRHGSDSEMANQIVAEGDASPADLFITENSPAMNIVDNAGLFSTVEQSTLDQVPALGVPGSKNWVGVAARSTVFIYNTTMLTEADLPTSLMDLQAPEWQGRWGAAAGGADFQAIISAVLAVEGPEATAEWLAGLKANAGIYKGNSAVMKAVNAGEIPAGVIYHYYWYGDQAKTGENSANTELLYFSDGDPGAFISVSGAGVLASSDDQAAAQRFLAFITSEEGQRIVAETVFEYPIAGPAPDALPALDSLEAPEIDPATLNGPEVVALMTDAGLL